MLNQLLTLFEVDDIEPFRLVYSLTTTEHRARQQRCAEINLDDKSVYALNVLHSAE